MRSSPARIEHDVHSETFSLSPSWRHALACAILVTGCLGGYAAAQPTFSIDFQGPKGMPSFTIAGLPISEGDILIAPFGSPAPGPLPTPGTLFAAGMNPMAAPNLMLPAYGFAPLPGGIPGMVEVDAISYGTDALLTPQPGRVVWTFSVDEFAAGLPAAAPPSVFTEGVFGAMQASADVFRKFPIGPFPTGPVPPFAWPPGNTLMFDGSGTPAPFVAPLPPVPGLLGLGLIEPNPPTPGALPDMGMNLDALDVDNMPTIGIWFSLDSAFADPLEPGAIVNSGSAVANGFGSGAAVIFKPLGLAPPIVYAPPAALGLDLIGGPDSDDLDALVLRENGVPGFQVSPAPYTWLGAAGTDMLLFSVRRGSAVIGAPDSIFGLPICEGDILVPPVAGGVSPFPGIFIAAENLGLATMRSTPGAVAFPPFSDELDALDVSPDCNQNGIPDYWDIKWMLAPDCNGNGIPDGCEIASGLASDCNCNGIPDSCDIASGILVDTDGDGIPNKCECPGDVNGNGTVNTADLLAVIAAWGACAAAPCAADISPAPCGNGVVNAADLLTVIGTWGPCP